MLATMAKKKPEKDRHITGTMVRLPDDLHRAVKRSAQINQRPMTWELRRLLEKVLTEEGNWPVPEE
jgi:hypothetical protein